MLRQFIADLEPKIMLIESLDLTENNTFNWVIFLYCVETYHFYFAPEGPLKIIRSQIV